MCLLTILLKRRMSFLQLVLSLLTLVLCTILATCLCLSLLLVSFSWLFIMYTQPLTNKIIGISLSLSFSLSW